MEYRERWGSIVLGTTGVLQLISRIPPKPALQLK